MKFLVDVCAGGRLSAWLATAGHDVQEVRNRDRCMPDEQVMEWAVKEKRIIITADKDFGELSVARGQRHFGIIRLPDVPFALRTYLLGKVLERQVYISYLEEGSIITVSSRRIRVRKFNHLG
ncbi:hypothetical protein SY88_02760 [Clostridiales bacterium PH28_bin88]|nr:hypothetical protein SY88_02760 [Clostridiales bacterium PH28_bin88]